MTDAPLCTSTTARMAPCRKEAVATVAGRPFCSAHAAESAGIMGQPRKPLRVRDACERVGVPTDLAAPQPAPSAPDGER